MVELFSYVVTETIKECIFYNVGLVVLDTAITGKHLGLQSEILGQAGTVAVCRRAWYYYYVSNGKWF